MFSLLVRRGRAISRLLAIQLFLAVFISGRAAVPAATSAAGPFTISNGYFSLAGSTGPITDLRLDATGGLGSIELRAASAAAHNCGRPIVSAEVFTSVLKFESLAWSFKKRGDWALPEGINRWMLHVYIHQPWEVCT